MTRLIAIMFSDNDIYIEQDAQVDADIIEYECIVTMCIALNRLLAAE